MLHKTKVVTLNLFQGLDTQMWHAELALTSKKILNKILKQVNYTSSVCTCLSA